MTTPASRPAGPFLFALAFGVLSALPLPAQLPRSDLRSLFPPGAQAGQQVEVTIGGSGLEECTALLFSHPGLTANPVREPASEFYPERPVPQRFQVNIAPDVPPGTYEVVAQTHLGSTSPHTFEVGSRPEVLHAADNSSVETAMPLPLDTIVNAHPDAEQIDYYRIELARDQRVLIQCRGEHLDSRIDATLVLTDEHGHELARDRDTLGRDAVLDFTAPAEGSYLVQVYDFIYRGGVEYAYRLVAGTAPHLDFIDPPAAQRGATGTFRLYGRNLPGGSRGEGVMLGHHELESLEVEIALAEHDDPGLVVRPVADSLVPGMEFRLAANGTASNAIRIGFAEAPVIGAAEGPDDVTVAPPCEIHGRFDQRGDLDRYRFEARKDEALWIEVIAERLRSELDPLLIIERITRDEQGQEQVSEITSSDDPAGNPGGREFPVPLRDPFLRFTPPEDGLYRITVLNQTSFAGPAALYRLVLRPPASDFALLATSAAAFRPDNQIPHHATLLRAGGTAILEIIALRRDGFSEAIAIAAEGLPAGVHAAPATIRAGENTTTLVLSSDETIADWDGFLTVTGTAGATTRVARPGTLSWPVANWDQDYTKTRLASRLPLSVRSAEKAPLVIVVPANQEVALDGTLEIPVTLQKHAPFAGEILVRPVGLPISNNPPQLKLNADQTEGKLAIVFKKTNEFAIAPGKWQFSLRAEGTMKFRDNPAAADRAEADRVRLEELEKALQELARQAEAAVEPARNELNAAEQNVASASGEARSALEATRDQARSRLQDAEAGARDASEKAKRAGEEKNRAAERAKQAAERSKERDLKHAAYSLPITVVVTPPPPTEAAKE